MFELFNETRYSTYTHKIVYYQEGTNILYKTCTHNNNKYPSISVNVQMNKPLKMNKSCCRIHLLLVSFLRNGTRFFFQKFMFFLSFLILRYLAKGNRVIYRLLSLYPKHGLNSLARIVAICKSYSCIFLYYIPS